MRFVAWKHTKSWCLVLERISKCYNRHDDQKKWGLSTINKMVLGSQLSIWNVPAQANLIPFSLWTSRLGSFSNSIPSDFSKPWFNSIIASKYRFLLDSFQSWIRFNEHKIKYIAGLWGDESVKGTILIKGRPKWTPSRKTANLKLAWN